MPKDVATKKKPVAKNDTSSESEDEVIRPQATKNVKGAGKAAAPKEDLNTNNKLKNKAKVAKKDSSDEESEDEQPKKVATKPAAKGNGAPAAKKGKAEESSDESDDSTPKKGAVKAQDNKKPAAKAAAKKAASSDDESSEDEKPKKTAAAKPAAKAAATKKAASSDDESSEDEKPKKAAAAKPAAKAAATKKAASSDDESSEEEKPKKAAAAKPAANNKEEPAKAKQNGGAGTGGEVFVRGLPFTASEEDIKAHFAQCGDVESINLLKGYDGRSKGIAFVRFNTDEEVQAAVGLDGTELGGRSIFVEKSTPKEQRGGQKGDQQGGARPYVPAPKSAQDPSSTTVFIGNLSYQSTEDSIREHFQDCGEILSVRVAKDQDGRMRGFGHIDFDQSDACKVAVEKAGTMLDGRAINVDFAGGKKGGDRNGGFGGGFGGGRGGFGGGFGGGRGGFGGGRGGRGGRGGMLSQDDSNAKKGAIGSFQGQKKSF